MLICGAQINFFEGKNILLFFIDLFLNFHFFTKKHEKNIAVSTFK